MFEVIETFFGELSRNIRLADILDIFLATGFLFGILIWLRRGLSGYALRGIAVTLLSFISIYSLSQLLGLYLMGRIIEIGFLVFLLGTVVVFQSDIRRLMDHIPPWTVGKTNQNAFPDEEHIDMLTEAIETMAKRRIGALIALKGSEPWQRQLHGGVELDGEMSLPLLYSLFNPTSPGHDGAILIENTRITRFGVHLPLSTHFRGTSKYGTRHAAALGLAERTDAFILVVSEERGEISIAEGGTLVNVNTASELKERLKQFWFDRSDGTSSATTSHWFYRNLLSAGISFGIAVILWLLFAYSPDTLYRSFDLPIVYQNLPPDWALVEPAPQKAHIALYGPQRAFQGFESENLMVVIDMRDSQEGINRKALSTDNLKLPANISLGEIIPNEIEIEVEKLVSRQLPITVSTTGELPSGFGLDTVYVQPDSLSFFISEDKTEAQDMLFTEPIDLSQITESTAFSRSVIIPSNAKLPLDEKAEVEIRVEVQRD